MICNTTYAQCTIQNNFDDAIEVIEIDYSEETHSYGQSFVAECEGNIEYFEISNSTQLGNFYAYSIEVFNGTDISDTPIYEQIYDQDIIIFNVGEPFRFVFDNDILLLEDQVYTILLTTINNSSFLISNTDNYNSGSAIIDGAFQTDKDLFFEILLSDPENNCNAGNEFIMADATNIVSGSSSTTYLHFRPVSFSNEGSLTGLGYTGLNTAGQLRLALYDDLNNSPNNLLAQTTITDFNFGKTTIPIAVETNINPGNYWIAYSVEAPTGTLLWRVDSFEPLYDSYYVTLNSFESDLPNQIENATLLLNDTQYPLFAEISCGLLSIDEYNYQNLKIYPNPTTQNLYFVGLTEEVDYTIYSLIGKRILNGKIMNNAYINVSNLNDGIYIIKLENGFSYKLIKE